MNLLRPPTCYRARAPRCSTGYRLCTSVLATAGKFRLGRYRDGHCCTSPCLCIFQSLQRKKTVLAVPAQAALGLRVPSLGDLDELEAREEVEDHHRGLP